MIGHLAFITMELMEKQKCKNWWLHTRGYCLRAALLLLLLLSYGVGLSAQLQHDYQWIFAFEDDTTSILDFRNDTFLVRKEFQDMQILSSNAIISDAQGELLFYSNGCRVYDASLNIMVNSDGLNPGDIADDRCDKAYTAGHQSMIVLPSISLPSIYHILHKRIIIDPETEVLVVSDTLFHTIVYLDLNNGLGEVVQKNKPINLERLNFGQMTAVKNATNDGWWIISGGFNSDTYEIYKLSSNENITVHQQSIDEPILETYHFLQTVLSPDGNLYIRTFAEQGIFLYDFDRELGELSNPRHIDFAIEPKFGGAAISSNGRFLYVNSLLEVWQFDLWAEDIEASKVLIATYDGYQSPFASTFFHAQLGPDCKLYYNSSNGVDVLHVMHNPNAKGLACNFEQHGVSLFTSHGASLPYFPSYRLDTDFPVCDTTRLVATSTYYPPPSTNQVWAAAPILRPIWYIFQQILRYDMMRTSGLTTELREFY